MIKGCVVYNQLGLREDKNGILEILGQDPGYDYTH